jgi:FlaA1/EpsC-like NDP-sugar epimerase
MITDSLRLLVLSLPRSLKRFLVIGLDSTLCALTAWAALALRLETWNPSTLVSSLPIYVAMAVGPPIFGVFGLYNAIFRFSGREYLHKQGRAVGMYGLIYFFIFTIVGFGGVPRSVGLMQPTLLFLAMITSRSLIVNWLGQSSATVVRSAVLIYGVSNSGRQLADSLVSSKQRQFLGFVDDDPTLWGNTIDSRKVYPSQELASVVMKTGATELWLAKPSVSSYRKRALIESLRGLSVRVLTIPTISDIASGKVRVSDIRELDTNELLGREIAEPNATLMGFDIKDKTVLVTGSGGSIGSELCRQIIEHKPAKLLLVDHSEFALYSIHVELIKILKVRHGPTFDVGGLLVPLLGSIVDQVFVARIFDDWRPHTVYHAAAYKHVPLVEHNPANAIYNNVWGTLTTAQTAVRFRSRKFILVSTDKAVRPTNVMGASKRLSEMVIQALNLEGNTERNPTIFSMVRFGNVLDSSGSVVPLFRRQIADGGPVTVTHPDIVRYFMTLKEAAQLVIQAGSMANGGDVFLLDMGKPVKIIELAERMITLSGFTVRNDSNCEGDIEIEITGLRPGEKLFEELLIGNDAESTEHPKIMRSNEDFLTWEKLLPELSTLIAAINQNNVIQIKVIMKSVVSGYLSEAKISDCLK